MRIVGCQQSREVSLTRDGANPLAHALVVKSKGYESTPKGDEETTPTPKPPAEKKNAMSTKSLQRILGMSDVTKSHFLSLSEDEGTAFLEKSVEVQDKEAADAAADIEKKRTAEAAKAAGKTEREVELEKSLGGLTDQVKDLQKKLADQAEQAEFAKIAADAELDGFPGGTDKVVETLKSVAGATDIVKASVISGMKAQAQLAKTLAKTNGTAESQAIIEKKAPSTHKVMEAAKKRAQENGTDVQSEIFKMKDEPAWRADLDKMYEEEGA